MSFNVTKTFVYEEYNVSSEPTWLRDLVRFVAKAKDKNK